MTTKDESLRAIRYTREFLWALADPKKTKRIPKEIRKQALRCLRHFPWDCHMKDFVK